MKKRTGNSGQQDEKASGPKRARKPVAVQLPSDGVSWEGESPDRVVGGARQEETRPSHNSESSKIDLISDTEPSKRRFQSAADSSSPAIYGGDLFLSQTIEESADVASKSDEILELKAVAMATFSSFATDDDEINIDAPLTAAASHSQTESRIEKGSELNCAGSSKVNEDEHIDNHIFLETVEFTPLIASPPAYKSTPKIEKLPSSTPQSIIMECTGGLSIASGPTSVASAATTSATAVSSLLSSPRAATPRSVQQQNLTETDSYASQEFCADLIDTFVLNSSAVSIVGRNLTSPYSDEMGNKSANTSASMPIINATCVETTIVAEQDSAVDELFMSDELFETINALEAKAMASTQALLPSLTTAIPTSIDSISSTVHNTVSVSSEIPMVDLAVDEISTAELLALEALERLENNSCTVNSDRNLSISSVSSIATTYMSTTLRRSASQTTSIQSPWSRVVSAVRSDELKLDDYIDSYRGIALNVSNRQNETLRTAEKLVKCYAPEFGETSSKLSHLSGDQVSSIVLRDEWCEINVLGGDIFNVVNIGESSRPENIKSLNNSRHRNQSALALGDIAADRGTRIVRSADRLFIIHPDVLVTPSKISEACHCPRKGVLSDRVRSIEMSSPAATLGSIKHVFMETAISTALLRKSGGLSSCGWSSFGSNLLSDDDVKGLSERAVRSNLEAMVISGLEESDVRVELRSVVEIVARFCDVASSSGLILKFEKVDALTLQQYKSFHQDFTEGCILAYFFVVERTSEIEKSLWAPSLGLKGQVDMVVWGFVELRVFPISAMMYLESVRDNPFQAYHPGGNVKPSYSERLFRCPAPLELKTGKWRPTSVLGHRAQTILYVLMLWMRDRNCTWFPESELGTFASAPIPDKCSDFGLLVYLNPELSKVEVVFPSWTDIKSLIMSRNNLALFIKRSVDSTIGSLPPLLRSEMHCNSCFQAAECMTYHCALESGDAVSSGTVELFQYSLRGFSRPEHMEYLQKWEKMLQLEACTMVSNLYTIWAVPATHVPALGGGCIGDLTVNSFEVVGSDTMLNVNSSILNDVSADMLTEGSLELSKSIGIISSENDRTKPLFSINIGDRVIVSLERTIAMDRSASGDDEYVVEPNLASGVVTELAPLPTGRLVVTVRVTGIPRRLLGIFGVSTHGASGVSAARGSSRWTVRIDRDEISYGVATLRSNLLRLFLKSHDPLLFKGLREKSGPQSSSSSLPDYSGLEAGNSRMRSLLVSLEKPEYNFSNPSVLDLDLDNPPSIFGKTYSGCVWLALRAEYQQLNEGQREAVRKVLAARDYVLLLGMPGTGKTSTVALIVRMLVSKGLKVLVASYTHSAVDNLLAKLKEAGVDESVALRIGSEHSVDERLKSYMIDYSDIKTLNNLRSKVHSARIIVCSALSAARHPLLQRTKFDWCIMDEAGQISQPAAIGPLLFAQKFLLVGDDYQLPPLIMSVEAKSMGMDVSLFKRLAQAHPHSIVTLSAQYRMNQDVMAICNSLIYENRLHCANEKIANARIVLPDVFSLPMLRNVLDPRLFWPVAPHSDTDWLLFALNPENPVVFLNTDRLYERSFYNPSPLPVAAVGSNLVNMDEVEIIRQILFGFDTCGFDLKEIGIISPYRAQVNAIRSCLSGGLSKSSEVPDDSEGTIKGATVGTEDMCAMVDTPVKEVSVFDVNTVDKFQGRDMEVVVISTVKSYNDGQNVGDLLRDWRRVNVAMTRAQKKLIILGSVTAMGFIPVLKELRKLVTDRNWVYSILRIDLEK